MIKVCNKKSLIRRLSFIGVCILLLGFTRISSIKVVATDYKSEPTFTISIDPLPTNPNAVKAGEDITVNGVITPQPFERPVKKKQIVLALDVSGSMNDNNKLTNLQSAGKQFIDQMKSIPGVEISIVAFSDEATINPTLQFKSDGTYYTHKSKGGFTVPDYKTLDIDGNENNFFLPVDGTSSINSTATDNYTILTNIIKNLRAEGGTNTGEGLRKAKYLLDNGDANASKSVVFMSDGLPTYHSIHLNGTDYLDINNHSPNSSGTDIFIDGGGTNDNDGKSKNYAKKIGNKIYGSNVNVYSIGYGLGETTSQGNVTMQEIHQSMGGRTENFYPIGENGIGDAFKSIGDDIIKSYTLTDIQMNLESAVNFNSNFSVIEGSNVINIRTVNYKMYRDGDRVIYKADPIPFSFIIKGNTAGHYDNLFQGGTLKVPWNGEILKTELPQVKVDIKDNSPVINATIVSQSPDPAYRTQDITLNCEIKPEEFNLNSTIFDESGPKDVIFLVDTSSEMSPYLTNLKNGLYGKIANNSEIKNAKYGIVTFDSSVKDNYVSDGLSGNTTALDSAIKDISCSSSNNRKFGDAMSEAETIFKEKGRTDSAKYIVLIASDNLEYTDDQLDSMEKNNYNIITVNLGHIDPPTKDSSGKVTPGATEPNNSIKTLHYNLMGKSDNGDNVLQKAENNYFIDINYSLVTDQANPNEFFTREDRANQMNDPNEVHNWILPLVAKKLAGGKARIQTPSYTFTPKLKFNLEGKFDSISGFNTCSDTNYNVETPEFNVKYIFKDGKYVPQSVDDIPFTIRIKDSTDTEGLKFGPGVISYTGLSNSVVNNTIEAYTLRLKMGLIIDSHGVISKYIPNQIPDITPGQDKNGNNIIFKYAQNSVAELAAKLKGSLNNSTGLKLAIPQEVLVTDNPIVWTYTDEGALTRAGIMQKSSSDNNRDIYIYNGVDIIDKNILIEYEEKMPGNPQQEKFINSLTTPDKQQKDVEIQISGDLPELF